MNVSGYSRNVGKQSATKGTVSGVWEKRHVLPNEGGRRGILPRVALRGPSEPRGKSTVQRTSFLKTLITFINPSRMAKEKEREGPHAPHQDSRAGATDCGDQTVVNHCRPARERLQAKWTKSSKI